MPELSKGYQPGDVEEAWYRRWVEAGCFHADESSERDSFSIVIPPPNVTGVLHLGHVLNNTIQDVLARRARMLGNEVLWLPGTDHAGIATQAVVERELRKSEKKTRHDLGRDEFLERVWDWKEKHGGIIIKQLKRLGCSCDWDRERFTMDPQYSRWISKVFVDLFNEGLIYRGKRMVNWCPKSLTALSDEEVIMKPLRSKLYFMRYAIAGEDGRFVEIATTRPETLMGDTGVAVNPNDKRYADLVGKNAIRPFPEAEIPIVADEHIDPEFGTGVLKVTPAHDKADFEIGLKHGLEIIDVFNPDGTLNAHAGPDFEGMDRFKARQLAVEKLEAMGRLVKVEDYENNVGFSERADVPVEPRISMQWFLKYPCKTEAAEAVASDRIHFRPERWKKTFAHWMENIRDWCVSRQLWWGHQIPVWYRLEKAGELRERESLDAESAAGDLHVGVDPPEDEENWIRDPDVLDTWFSSWLWPFATMTDSDSEPSPTERKFYPTTDLVTAPEIIFFWVARMIMAGYRWRGEPPFQNVFFTGIVRDGSGRKMSKSLGNSPDPLDIIEDYGADALRFAIMRVAPLGGDIRFEIANEDGVEIYPQVVEGRNFANKLWNAARYRQMQEDGPRSTVDSPQPGVAGGLSAAVDRGPSSVDLSIYAIDILSKLDALEKNIAAAYERYRFNEVAQLLYEFFWSEYCDWYLESAKNDFREGSDPGAKAATLGVMDTVLSRYLLQLHPFMPHITEELWEKLGFRGDEEFIMRTPLRDDSPLEGIPGDRVAAARERTAAVYEAVGRLRNLKAEYNLAANRGVRFILDPAAGWVAGEAGALSLLAGAAGIDVAGEDAAAPPSNCPAAATPLGTFRMPLEGLIDVAAERDRLGKERQKIDAELQKVVAKLQNPDFLDRAKPEVVEEARQRKENFLQRRRQLQEMIENLT